MRELKFRAWRETSGSMHRIVILDFVVGSCVCDDGLGFTLDEIVIEQYTGLHDKNGTEIYEGDIVRFFFDAYGKNPGTEMIDVVMWVDGAFYFWWIEGKRGARIDKFHGRAEVIGNIHENPELVGGTT
jgi:uncharacterized phage protein (TIGR01671 family)